MSENEWFSRTIMAIGDEAMDRLRKASVLVAGLGGVGAWAAEMICRAGIGSMTIADGDIIMPANRNRQLLALKSTEGRLKAEVMAERLLDINPELSLAVVNEYIRDAKMTEVLKHGYDYVIDAIDTLSPKAYLIFHARSRNIRVVSSMGAGGRFDPLQIMVSDISESHGCSLARAVRKRLRRLGVSEGVKVVYSPEEVAGERIKPVSGERNKASAVGTLSYVPAAFGIVCASVVIRDIAGL